MAQTLTKRWLDFSYTVLKKFQSYKPPETLPIHLHAKRIYVLPTKFGLFFCVFLGMMLLGALNYNNNMALLLTFLLGGLILLSPLYTVRNLIGLDISQIGAEPVFLGDPAIFTLAIVNPSNQSRPVIWLEAGEQPVIAQIPGAGRTTVELPSETRQRGWLKLNRVRMFTSYPLGLFFSWAWLEPDVKCLVYPKPEAEGPGLPMGNDHLGERQHRHGDEEWDGMRDYQAGDSPRLIAWKTVAKSNEMVTKTFAEHEGSHVFLDYASINGLDPEARLSRLTRWVLEAERQGVSYALQLPGQVIQANSGADHQHQCLRALAEY